MIARKRWSSWSERIEAILLWIFTIALLADVLLGILTRYVQFDIVFADELGKYLFIWLCLTGISAATRDNQHVRLSFIASRLPLGRKFIRVTNQLLFLVFSLLLLYWSLRLTWSHFIMDKSVMGFRFPIFWFTAALPVGFGLTAFRLIEGIISSLRKGDTTPGAQYENLVEDRTRI